MKARARRPWALFGLIGSLALVTYLPSLGNGFALDDVPAVAQDERIRGIGRIPGLLDEPYLTYMPRERSPYRPVTTASYALSWSSGSGHPLGFHGFNVVAHAAASLLLLSLLLRLGAGRWAGLLGAAVFAVHPLHVEAVAGVVGRADVLMTLFCLLGVRLYLSEHLGRAARTWLVAAAYLLALGSKESAVVLPLLIVLVEVIRPGLGDEAAGAAAPPAAEATAGPDPSGTPLRSALGRVLATWPTHAALAATLALFLLMRIQVLGAVAQLDVAAYIVALPTSLRLSTAVANLAEVARLLLVPIDLVADYGPGVITPAGLSDPRFWLGALVGVGAAVLFVRGLLRDGASAWIALGIGWAAIAFALVSNLVLPMPMWIAERTLYLSSVGVSLCLVGVLQALSADRVRAATVTIGVACLVGAVHAARRSTVWESDAALFGDLVTRHPESFRAQWWLGGQMIDAGDLGGGIVWLERAVENSPNSVLLTLDYVRALLLTGRNAEAEARVRPISPALHPSRSVFLAQSLIFQDRPEEAAEVVREGLRYFPDEPRLLDQARALGVGG